MNPLIVGLVISLAISLAGNAFLGRAYLGQRDTAVVAVVKTEQATGAALACSAGVDDLQTKAETRRLEAAPRVEAAKQAAAAGNRKADVILATPATAPGDDCKSATDRVDAWWADRGVK